MHLPESIWSGFNQYTTMETKAFRTEADFLEAVEGLWGRAAPVVVPLDGQGKMFCSEEFAGWIGRPRDGGAQNLVFAVGSADGWSEGTLNWAGWVRPTSQMRVQPAQGRLWGTRYCFLWVR